MNGFQRISLATAAAVVSAALATGAAGAQMAAKPHKNATPSIAVVITNSRAVALTELDATPTGEYIPKKIAANLAPGKRISVNLTTDKNCVFNLHGAYADGTSTDSTGVDLCKDKTVNLVD